MEILRVVPLIGFIIFINQISFTHRKLKNRGISFSHPHRKKKSLLTAIFLVIIAMFFTAELFIQSGWPNFSYLPKILKQTLHQSDILAIVGVFAIILSNISIYLTFISFGSSMRFSLNKKNRGKLITTGILAYTRNPFFLTIILHFVGIALVLPNIFFAAIAILSILFIHFFILKEERFMLENYGEEYRNYCKKVRRYF